MGCDQDGCMAQLAGAFGARYVIYGSIAVLGDLYVVQLTLFDGDQARPFAAVVWRPPTLPR